ncbi:MAG: 4-hydroxy-3-methylbut-2-enyl diphosphate reductase [Bacteroidales bacterium]|nr:4-hydroxy-3-methylbut-2-enyl diphosphate reductase [Bacteroidales bacterium]
MQVEIDPHSGFCGGVIRAIGTAEKFLDAGAGRLYSLGAIVHNEEELARLASRGLVTIEKEDLRTMPHPAPGQTLLIRAHGEPPQVYGRIREMGFEVIDCTCPVVLGLQKKIREAYARMTVASGQVVLFGKIGHPEVLGLVGQVPEGGVVVVETPVQLQERIADGSIRIGRDIELFSQTTMSPEGYARVREILREAMRDGASLEVHDTICQQVASRHRELSDFARTHDAVVFVSGRESSNGKVLCALCRRANPRTFHIGAVSQLERGWFRPDDRVGVCGATSTPKWLLEEVAAAIKNLH